jgi:hypothetical protein
MSGTKVNDVLDHFYDIIRLDLLMILRRAGLMNEKPVGVIVAYSFGRLENFLER